jgi:hypothetical protein
LLSCVSSTSSDEQASEALGGRKDVAWRARRTLDRFGAGDYRAWQ